METIVAHCKKEGFDFYIGRKNHAHHFGNPFGFGEDKSKLTKICFKNREECIDAFRKWILGTEYQDIEPERREWILKNMHRLRGNVLGCYCYPLPCHGDVYVEILDGKIKTNVINFNLFEE